MASVSAEVADSVEELRRVCADVFAGWIDGGTDYFRARGLEQALAREVTIALVGALEGAFLLARALRTTESLLVAGQTLAPRYRGVALAPPLGVGAGGGQR